MQNVNNGYGRDAATGKAHLAFAMLDSSWSDIPPLGLTSKLMGGSIEAQYDLSLIGSSRPGAPCAAANWNGTRCPPHKCINYLCVTAPNMTRTFLMR